MNFPEQYLRRFGLNLDSSFCGTYIEGLVDILLVFMQEKHDSEWNTYFSLEELSSEICVSSNFRNSTSEPSACTAIWPLLVVAL